MTILYHGTQSRFIPNIFESGVIIGFWTPTLKTAIDYTIVTSPIQCDIGFITTVQTPIVLALYVPDVEYQFESASGYGPDGVINIDGVTPISALTHGYRYTGKPITHRSFIINKRDWEHYNNPENWEKISVKQLRRYTKITKSILNGMLFIEPSSVALKFKQIYLSDRSDNITFDDRNFVLESAFSLDSITLETQHLVDNGYDVIVFESNGVWFMFISLAKSNMMRKEKPIACEKMEKRLMRQSYKILGD